VTGNSRRRIHAADQCPGTTATAAAGAFVLVAAIGRIGGLSRLMLPYSSSSARAKAIAVAVSFIFPGVSRAIRAPMLLLGTV
jgi:hypothetical protein